MLHIICALKPEARPLLDYFAMQPVAGRIPIYGNPDRQITLTISGIGKPAAAAAVNPYPRSFQGRQVARLA